MGSSQAIGEGIVPLDDGAGIPESETLDQALTVAGQQLEADAGTDGSGTPAAGTRTADGGEVSTETGEQPVAGTAGPEGAGEGTAAQANTEQRPPVPYGEFERAQGTIANLEEQNAALTIVLRQPAVMAAIRGLQTGQGEQPPSGASGAASGTAAGADPRTERIAKLWPGAGLPEDFEPVGRGEELLLEAVRRMDAAGAGLAGTLIDMQGTSQRAQVEAMDAEWKQILDGASSELGFERTAVTPEVEIAMIEMANHLKNTGQPVEKAIEAAIGYYQQQLPRAAAKPGTTSGAAPAGGTAATGTNPHADAMRQAKDGLVNTSTPRGGGAGAQTIKEAESLDEALQIAGQHLGLT